jgi:hypothetical protein
VGAVALWVVRGATRPLLRLGLLLFGGFSAATGFGYLMVDPLFASKTNDVGDYKVVVELLGGGAGIRVPLIVVGAAGWVGTMFVLARLAWRFVDTVADRDATALPGPAVPGRRAAVRPGPALRDDRVAVRPDRPERLRTAGTVLLAPYLTAGVFFSVLVVPSHPLGAPGVVASLLQYWFGYSLFIWAFGLAGTWLKLDAVDPPVTPLPPAHRAALVAGAVAVAVALLATPSWGF